MRYAAISLATLAGFVIASETFAQPAAIRRPVVPPGQQKKQEQQKQAPAQNPMCPSKRAILEQDRQRLDSYRAELSGVEAELSALQRRIDELNKRRNDLRGLARAQESRIARNEQTIKKECQADDGCERLEQAASDLDTRSASVERELDAVRTEIGTNARSVNELRQRIEPLQREYNDKKCNNLVPGETAQSTIDRCSAIFSDWNRLQAELNRQNNRMPELRSRYEQLMSELRSLESRGTAVSTQLTRQCSGSAKVQVVQNVTTRRERGSTVGQELDKLVEDIRNLRGIQITVQAR